MSLRKMNLRVVIETVLVLALAVEAYQNFYARRALRLLKEEQAALTAGALGNSVVVDGVELPKPEDDRWTNEDGFVAGDVEVAALRVGVVRITEGGIYIGNGKRVPAMPDTARTKKYCTSVWKAYRSRLARKSIESTT